MLTLGAVVLAVGAGCGGGSAAPAAPAAPAASAVTTSTSATGAAQGARSQGTRRQTAAPRSPRRAASAVARTPQQAVRTYVEGIHAANGAAVCDVMDTKLQREVIAKIVRERPIEAGDTCPQALTDLAAEVTTPGERRPRLPRLNVTTIGSTDVGVYSHARRTYALVKHGDGWLIDRISGPREVRRAQRDR
jgi:metal-dependent amidase/aminoacylase/carboxypeptidase family protein